MVIPIMTFLANFAILLDIPILREIVVFIFLSFVPGFAILKLFKLKEDSFLDTILFSVALSIAFVMFIGLLVNELYLFIDISPLSTIPLTAAISAFTLIVFFIDYRRDLSDTLEPKTRFNWELKNVLPLSIILFLLPLLSALGVLFLNISVILLSDTIIAALCIMSVMSKRLVPERLFPFLILSISLALVFQVLLTSKYIVGYDANFEYYVFRLTQINGHWGFLNANVNPTITLTYDSMLSITLLPAVYSALMHAQGEIIFKMLYPFIFSLIPLTLYRVCAKQFGKLVGLTSGLLFVLTSSAFYGVEPLSLNRQIVGELFLLLSIFLLIDKTIPVANRRWLLIIFGAALAVSHYSLAYISLVVITFVFIISKLKPKFDDTLNAVTVLLLYLVTFSWYAIGASSPLTVLTYTIKATLAGLTGGQLPINAVTASAVFYTPQVFKVSTYINATLSGIVNIFLIIGILVIILRRKRLRVSAEYLMMMIIGAAILAVSFISPVIASILNFTRFYAITLLFLSPCFFFGGKTFLATIGKVLKKIKRPPRSQLGSKSKNINMVFLLIAIILSGYFLSQVGFVNYVTQGDFHSYSTDFEKMIASNESQVKISLYSVYIPEQDVFSASWLSNNQVGTQVSADPLMKYHVLVSYGLVPAELILPLINITNPPLGSFVYLGTLNIVNSVITAERTATNPNGSFNASEISVLLDQNNLVYSNGNSEIWYVVQPIASS
jgi:uncharacterized membrane protein